MKRILLFFSTALGSVILSFGQQDTTIDQQEIVKVQIVPILRDQPEQPTVAERFSTYPMPNGYRGANSVTMPNGYRGDNSVPMPNVYRDRLPKHIILKRDGKKITSIPDSLLGHPLNKRH